MPFNMRLCDPSADGVAIFIFILNFKRSPRQFLNAQKFPREDGAV